MVGYGDSVCSNLAAKINSALVCGSPHERGTRWSKFLNVSMPAFSLCAMGSQSNQVQFYLITLGRCYVLRLELNQTALLFVVADSFDMVCHLGKGLFPTPSPA